VISIIAILAALLLPALKNSKERAKTIACKGNMRQTILLTINYATDHNGWTPKGYEEGTGLRWYSTLQNGLDLKSLNIFKCPSANDGGMLYLGFRQRAGSNKASIRILAATPEMITGGSPSYQYIWTSPSKLLLFGDACDSNGKSYYIFHLNSSTTSLQDRHYGRINTGFACGRVIDVAGKELNGLDSRDATSTVYRDISGILHTN